MKLAATISLFATGTSDGAIKGWESRRRRSRGSKPRVSKKMNKRISYPKLWKKKQDVISRWKKLTKWRIKVVGKRIKQLVKRGMDKTEAFKQATQEVTKGKLDKY